MFPVPSSFLDLFRVDNQARAQTNPNSQTRAGVYGAHPAEDAIGGHHTVTEPHTGLPMNVERFGDGHGGTDGSATVPGHHAGQEGATDWEAVKKGDTVY